jgi:rod shape-determining protein MreD
MLRNLLWAVTVVSLGLLQTMWPDVLKVQGAVPDLVLILVVYFAIAEGEERAMFTALLGGIYNDAASGTILGHHILGLVLVGYVTARVSTRLITEHPAVKAGLVLCAAGANGVCFTAVQYVQQPDTLFINTLVLVVLPGAFYTAVLSPFFFYACDRFFHARPTVAGVLR